MRGPQYKGFAKGGDKALFWIGELAQARRVAITESAIDALSLAALERYRQVGRLQACPSCLPPVVG